MRRIHEVFEDEEYDYLSSLKGDMTWREYLKYLVSEARKARGLN